MKLFKDNLFYVIVWLLTQGFIIYFAGSLGFFIMFGEYSEHTMGSLLAVIILQTIQCFSLFMIAKGGDGGHE